VAVEGSEASYPGSLLEGGARPPNFVLPPENVYQQKPRYFEIFNRGREPFRFSIQTVETWLRISQSNGTVAKDQRIWVSIDWGKVPVGTTRGTVAISGPDNRKVTITVPVVNPENPRPGNLNGFAETDGYVSIEASHFTSAVAPNSFKWQVLPGFGRTLAGVTVSPVAGTIPANSMRLEYRMYLSKGGSISVDAYFAPTQNFQPGEGLRYAISFDDEPPQVVNVHADESKLHWDRTVLDGVTELTSAHVVATPGAHVLKYWALDSGLVLEKLVVDAGGMKPSYLGPPESPRIP
jgi:hypothetical protein